MNDPLKFIIATIDAGQTEAVFNEDAYNKKLKGYYFSNLGIFVSKEFLHEVQGNTDLYRKQLNVNWTANRFADYHKKAKEQLGELWNFTDTATIAICNNLQLVWNYSDLNWVLSSDGIELGRFILPFEDHSLQIFQRLCSTYYRSKED